MSDIGSRVPKKNVVRLAKKKKKKGGEEGRRTHKTLSSNVSQIHRPCPTYLAAGVYFQLFDS